MSDNRKVIEWQPVREAFVRRAERPEYAELASEFSVAETTLRKCANEEGWTVLRAQYLERQLVAADASSVMLEAVKVDRTLLNKFTHFALVTLEKITSAVESIDDSRAPQTKLDAANTATFAAKNLADALRQVGIIGVAKRLDAGGLNGANKWEPGMLQQINVNLSGLQAAIASVPGASPVNVSAEPVPPTASPTVQA